MFADLQLLLNSIFNLLSDIWLLYVGGGILTGVLALWLLRQVVKFFKRL